MNALSFAIVALYAEASLSLTSAEISNGAVLCISLAVMNFFGKFVRTFKNTCCKRSCCSVKMVRRLLNLAMTHTSAFSSLSAEPMEPTSPCKSCCQPASRLSKFNRMRCFHADTTWIHIKAYWALGLRITGAGRLRASHGC